MASRRIYLAQVNKRYGQNVFLPYSVGLIWAFARQDPIVAANFEVAEFLYMRDPIDDVLGRMVEPDVLGLSCYVWNWEYNRALAAAVKRRYPTCLVVLGGPHVPDRTEDFFQLNPFADILVHQEGEAAFHQILVQRLSAQPRYEAVGGITVRGEDGTAMRTGPGTRMTELDTIPSPYLLGLFDDLMKAPFSFHASQETHRGCPYACTFCDWGSATFSKVRSFSDERVVSELEWFGRHKIDLLYNCDANYGLLKRDVELTRAMVDTKARFGFPNRFRAAYAKKSNDRVFEIAKLLSDAGMNKGVTLSLQSMDEGTLEIVKRANIKMTDFSRLVRKYKSDFIATYTELIIGLPGESYESFRHGLETIMEAGQHDSISIYPCMLLPNSELTQPDSLRIHSIQSVRTPVIWLHASPDPADIPEYYDVIVATASMPHDQWRKAMVLGWMIQAYHCLGLLQYVAIFARHYLGVAHVRFYERIIEYAGTQPGGAMARELTRLDAYLDRLVDGRGIDIVMPEFGDVLWPPEEAMFLNAVREPASIYADARATLVELAKSVGKSVEEGILDDLFVYQANMIKRPSQPAQFDFEIAYDLPGFFALVQGGEAAPLAPVRRKIAIASDFDHGGDLETFAREVVWYGRKGGSMRHAGPLG